MSCCEKWVAETDPAGRQQIEQLSDGEWAVNGCCGGGCYVIDEVRFCPFCGAAKS